MDCCPNTSKTATPACHADDGGGHRHGRRIDFLLYGSLAVIAAAFIVHFALPVPVAWMETLAASIVDLMKTMWWGIVLGIFAVGAMQKLPREYFTALLGRGDTVGGLLRAALAGLVLDLCSHGILMVGAQLYKRGASLAQVMTFLIASPWNSLSLTLILFALIGVPWTLVFIAGSAAVAVVTGLIYLALTRCGAFPANPASAPLPEGFDLRADAARRLKTFRPGGRFFGEIITGGFRASIIVMRWLFFGTILAALIRTFVSDHVMVEHFGPTLLGLLFTLLVTTVVEVCSEGSAPIGAELVNRAMAPGNGFAFLMAGVSTDYTEIMVIREMTRSWKIALSLPLITVPQIMLLGWIMNMAGSG